MVYGDNERVYQVIKMGALKNIPDDIKNVDVFVSDWMGKIVLKIRQRSLARTVEKHSYPETWWDAVKARWYPKWLKARFPVQMVTVTTEDVMPSYDLDKHSFATIIE